MADVIHMPPGGAPEFDAPFGLSLDEFVALETTPPVPLLGDERNTILPETGLAIIAGHPSIGKTTLAIDLAFHLASKIPWLEFPVGRACNILLLENEGPQHMFRQKLKKKAEAWEAALEGQIYVQTWRWGYFSFADQEVKQRARQYLADNHIDVVIGDPLSTLGMKGVGSPEDVATFVRELTEIGLNTTTAFVFLHHFRKEGDDDEIKSLQGAWGGPLDTLITVKSTGATNELRINLPKLRWAEDTFQAIIVGMVRNVAGFERLGEEGDPVMLEPKLIEMFGDGHWRTLEECANAGRRPPDTINANPGIGANKQQVKAVLQSNPHLFCTAPGNEHGRSAKAVLWQLAQGDGASPGESNLRATVPVPEPEPDDLVEPGLFDGVPLSEIDWTRGADVLEPQDL